MARIHNNAKLNTFLENDDNFEAVSYDDPRAIALRAKEIARNRRRQVTQDARKTANTAMAASFSIGQVVKHSRRPFDRSGPVSGPVVAIDGETITIERANGIRTKYIATDFVAA